MSAPPLHLSPCLSCTLSPSLPNSLPLFVSVCSSVSLSFAHQPPLAALLKRERGRLLGNRRRIVRPPQQRAPETELGALWVEAAPGDGDHPGRLVHVHLLVVLDRDRVSLQVRLHLRDSHASELRGAEGWRGRAG